MIMPDNLKNVTLNFSFDNESFNGMLYNSPPIIQLNPLDVISDYCTGVGWIPLKLFIIILICYYIINAKWIPKYIESEYMYYYPFIIEGLEIMLYSSIIIGILLSIWSNIS